MLAKREAAEGAKVIEAIPEKSKTLEKSQPPRKARERKTLDVVPDPAEAGPS